MNLHAQHQEIALSSDVSGKWYALTLFFSKYLFLNLWPNFMVL